MNRGTELFELFGEEVHCSICLTDVEQGERVRAVTVCQHSFHATCLEEWGLRQLICPNCRQPFGGDPMLADEDLVPVLVPASAVQMQEQQEGVEPLLPQASQEEQLLTYVLLAGIIQRFPAAGWYTPEYRDKVGGLIDTLVIAGVRPLRYEYQNRNQLISSQARCRYHLGISLDIRNRNLTSDLSVRLWKERVINYLHTSNTDFWKLWARDTRERMEVRRRLEDQER